MTDDNWVRQVMDDRGITVKEMADALNLSETTVDSYYHGYRSPGRKTEMNMRRILDLEDRE